MIFKNFIEFLLLLVVNKSNGGRKQIYKRKDETRWKKLPTFLFGVEKNFRWEFWKNPHVPSSDDHYTVKTQKGGQRLPAFFI